ncbi:MAG TPA: S49 family peptidase [Pirellulales bacterium]
MLRRQAWWIVLLLLVVGCKRPIKVISDSRITAFMPNAHSNGPVRPMTVAGGDPGQRKIALIDVDGLLVNQVMTGVSSDGENPIALFREKLDLIAGSPCYAAVVIRINSPGGGVTASDVMWHDLREFKARKQIPVVACLMDVGAGGAYYVATGADHVVAHPTTVTGGIGVILNLYNLVDLMNQFNVVPAAIKAGVNIDLGTPVVDQTPEGQEILQRMANEFHDRFRKVVLAARPQMAGAPAEVFDGRVFTAYQALHLKMIDSIGYLDDAVNVAAEMGGAPGAQLVAFHRVHDKAYTPYDVTPNVPLQSTMLPLSIPGFERAKLPTFLYLWQPDPTIERLTGK